MIASEQNRDIFETVDEYIRKDKHVVFFHGCNAQGVMGAGVAKRVKKRWPHVFKEYQKVCNKRLKDELLGSLIIRRASEQVVVVNGITQWDYGRDKVYAREDAIQECIEKLDFIFDIDPGYDFPTQWLTVRIGCGLGGLEWKDVRPHFEESKIPWQVHYLED